MVRDSLQYGVGMVLLIGFLCGNTALDPLLGMASLVLGVSVVLFAVDVFKNIRE